MDTFVEVALHHLGPARLASIMRELPEMTSEEAKKAVDDLLARWSEFEKELKSRPKQEVPLVVTKLPGPVTKLALINAAPQRDDDV